MEKVKLEHYAPSVGTFDMYIPVDYVLEDDEESGIVSVSPPDGSSSLTLSSYIAEFQVDERIIRDFFNDMVKGYKPDSDLRFRNEKNLVCTQWFFKDSRFWIWWAIGFGNQIVAASVNSAQRIDDEEIGLYEFIIDHIEIIL